MEMGVNVVEMVRPVVVFLGLWVYVQTMKDCHHHLPVEQLTPNDYAWECEWSRGNKKYYLRTPVLLHAAMPLTTACQNTIH